MSAVHGVLVIDKPRGMTSTDVVARVKRALGSPRVGHTGTLDPMATGVLPVVVGEGTKIAPFLLADDKEYEGEVTARAPCAGIGEEALRQAMAAWIGERVQVPPAHSALRVSGQRAYDLARRGVAVELAARAVRIDRFDLLSFAPPLARFRVACGKGTYVRSLVRDVGAALGCGATLSALRRLRAGCFTLADAVPLAGVAPGVHLVSPAQALAHLPVLALDAAGVTEVGCGRRLPVPAGALPGQRFRLLTPVGGLAAVAEVSGAALIYVRVFRYGLTVA